MVFTQCLEPLLLFFFLWALVKALEDRKSQAGQYLKGDFD